MNATRNTRSAPTSRAHGFLLIAISVLMAGCESGPTSRNWSEDVLFEDGTGLVVERHVEFEVTDSFARDAPNLILYKSTLVIRDSGGPGFEWSRTLIPILLYPDMAAREWVLVASTVSCETWREHGRPTVPYWEFRLRPSGWTAVPLSSTSIGRRANLFVVFLEPLALNHLTIAQKAYLLRNSRVS
jgi:hypothetical protein